MNQKDKNNSILATLNRAVWVALTTCIVSFAGCRPHYPNCKHDEQCQENEYCVNNRCQQCRDNSDCAQGKECAVGVCREIPSYCQQSTDCEQGLVCKNNRCEVCTAKEDCPKGTVCIEGTCGPAECYTSNECPAGLSCVNYRCKPDDMASTSLPGECRLEPIYFNYDSANISRQMRDEIEGNYDCLKNSKDRITLEGHCDPRGTTEYNMGLGERRARRVHKIIRTMGFDSSRMRVVSKGEEEATGHGEDTWARDRRVSFQ